MPRVTRTRLIAASPERVWALVSDPHHLPRWWPRALRVEDVRGEVGSRRTQWTLVLGTAKGRGVRADYRAVSVAAGERFIFEQRIEETPFERIVRSAEIDVRLEGTGESTEVTLTSDERLRGLSRLGSAMMRGAAKRRLDEALEGIERAVGE
jgi:uncharacterized protein YndB with AHSA1/START domain